MLGERRTGRGRTRYQLAFSFFVRQDVIKNKVVVELKVRLHLTDPSGQALDGAATTARRKKITKSWWNHEWLSRQLAITCHLVGDHESGEIVIGHIPGEQVRLSGSLLSATVAPGINDVALEPLRAKVNALNAHLSTIDEDSESLGQGVGGGVDDFSEQGE